MVCECDLSHGTNLYEHRIVAQGATYHQCWRQGECLDITDWCATSMNPLANLVLTFLTFILLLMVVSFVYDLGQILVARWYGVRTHWRFGYVKFLGEYSTRSLMARAAIIAAGLSANFLLAILLLGFTFSQSGVNVTAARVDEVVAGGVAAEAGFQVGDLIISIDERRIESFDEMQSIVRASGGRELVFRVDRGGVVTQLKAIPTRQEISDRFGNRLSVGVMGIRRNPKREDRRYRPIEYVRVAVNDSYHFVWRTLDLAVGKGEGELSGGPFRIAPSPKEERNRVLAFLRGIAPYVNLVAVLSVSTGLIKLILWLSLFVRP